MSKIKTHVQKGDEVEVISGNHKGKTGTVLSVNTTKNTAIVEGVRSITKAVRPTEASPDGGLVQQDGPIHLSNLKKVG